MVPMVRHRMRAALAVVLLALVSLLLALTSWSPQVLGRSAPPQLTITRLELPPPVPDAVSPPAPALPVPAALLGWETDTQLAQARARAEAEARTVPEPTAAAARVPATTARVEATLAAEATRRWGRGQLLLAVPRLGVTAAVTPMGYAADGRTLATPNSPWGVAWYQFTGYPGGGGNAVLAGHVDWYTGAPAVFAGLGQLGVGDRVELVRADGRAVVYAVASVESVRPDTANVAAILGPTSREAVTLITCGGAWDPVAHDYSHRLIVRAYRLP